MLQAPGILRASEDKMANPDFLIRYNPFSSKRSSAKVSSLGNKTKNNQKKHLEAVKTKGGRGGEAEAGYHVTVVKTDLHSHGEWAPRAGEAGLI